MSRRYVITLLLCALVLAVALPAAQAELLRVGPTDPAVGYPRWYQDRTGLALELCLPNAAELTDGWCLLLPQDVPGGAPETFPTNFADEHFYWAADASADATINGADVRALLVLGLEAAFSVGPPVAGDQIVFGRVRIRVDPLPYSGTYTVYTPFGKYVFADQVAGERLFFTEDIGITCAPGDFTCALTSKVGPFLLPSSVPGGPELPPVDANTVGVTPYPGTGKKYIADPGAVYKVTGSPLPPFVSAVDGVTRDHNIFRIEVLPTGQAAPILMSETTDFALMGRIYEGTIAGRVTADRASYARSGSGNKLDVFATGLPSTTGRLPAGTAPSEVTPQLQYFDAPCVANLDENGVLLSYSAPAGTPTQMLGAGTSYWGQSQPATIPAEVCVNQLNAPAGGGQTTSAFFPAAVGDQVFISEALYDPQAQSLSVKASSSDLATPPTLTAQGFGTLANGALVVTNLTAPPSKVRVTSSASGANELQVSTGVGGTGPGQTVPTAVNDAVTVAEDSGAQTIQVLGNDTFGGQAIPVGSVVTLASLPRLGTASANADGTVRYTPNANANGSDSFTYTVAVNGLVSNAANVAVTITPANDPPVALNDSFNAFVNVAVPLAVLANDTDVDGAADLVAIDSLTAPTPAGATATVAGNAVSFLATTPGTYTFTYRAKDATGATSANTATVTVNVAGGETITVSRAEFRSGGARLRIEGTISPVTTPPQRLEVRWANGSNTVSVVATPVADAAGLWAVDLRGVTGIQDPRNSNATQVVVTSPAGGSSPVTNLTIR
jgi:hypothetical protein